MRELVYAIEKKRIGDLNDGLPSWEYQLYKAVGPIIEGEVPCLIRIDNYFPSLESLAVYVVDKELLKSEKYDLTIKERDNSSLNLSSERLIQVEHLSPDEKGKIALMVHGYATGKLEKRLNGNSDTIYELIERKKNLSLALKR